MRVGRWRPYAAVVVGLLLVALAGCARGTATVQVPVPTATPGDITLTLDRATYLPNEPMSVTVTNKSKTTYYARDGRSACSIVQLQQYVPASKQWVSVDGCTSAYAPQYLALPPGIVEPLTLAPGADARANSWNAGVYRVGILYHPKADGSGGDFVVYSAGFTVAAR